MNRRTALIFYFLSAYVIVQFVWWGFHLIDLTQEINKEQDLIRKRVIMIIGEGAVFLLLVMLGIWQIRKSIFRDFKLSERQKNFLLSVTHELKTPLAANKLYIQTVTKRELDQEQRNELLKKAIAENVRLETMIDNILNASRIENKALSAQKEAIDLHTVLVQLVERFRGIWPQAKLETASEPGVLLHGDRIMIESIIGNLIENAIKYAGNSRITVYGFAQDGKTVFGVKDEGAGIPKELRSDIFKKFYRIGSEETRGQKGSGLGLYIVDQLVRLQKGSVRCLDNVPQGTNFEIKI